jgi:segregation and condensation protein B
MEIDMLHETPDTVTETATAPVSVERSLEAILMIADEPQTLVSLATSLGVPVAAVRQSIERLVTDYDGHGGGAGGGAGGGSGGGIRRGFELREVGGGWRIYVRGEYDDVVRDFVLTQNPTRLSQAALETLAVIAYKQPISRGAIASIRAVNVDSVVRTLLGRGLITEAFTDSETGAIHYETTDLTLSQLGINSIDELPAISPLLTDGLDGFADVL